VYPDDVLAVQHTRDSGAFLHCPVSEPSLNSPWRQSYLSLRGPEGGGWWEGGLSSAPTGGRWVDGVVCDLRVLYADAVPGKSHEPFPGRMERPRDDVDDLPDAQMTSEPDVDTPAPTTPPSHISGLEVVHPVPDGENRLHVRVNVPVLVVIKIRSGGTGASSSWSAPVLQTGVLFRPSCPEELTRSWDGCERESPGAWFSSATLMLPSAGAHSLEVSAVNSASTQRVGVTVWGYEAVTGLSVEPRGHLRVLTDLAQVWMSSIHTHTDTHTHTHTHTHTYTHTTVSFTGKLIHTHTHTHTHTHSHTPLSLSQANSFTYTHTHTRTHARTHTRPTISHFDISSLLQVL